jgi:hypothetical protein
MESHVRNVELFHRLMQIQVDWLSDAETRLFTLRRPSRLVSSAQQQLDAHRVIDTHVLLLLFFNYAEGISGRCRIVLCVSAAIVGTG